MDIQATLAWREENIDEEGSTDVKGTAPLPYLYFEYRRLFSDNWRFTTGLGWLYIEFDDVKGGQWIGRFQIEYLTDKRWGFGAAINIAQAGVDWTAIATEEQDILDARVDLDINDFSVFFRVRFLPKHSGALPARSIGAATSNPMVRRTELSAGYNSRPEGTSGKCVICSRTLRSMSSCSVWSWPQRS
jgi:hypothetical protein